MRLAPRPLTALLVSAALLLGGAAMAQDDHLLDFNSLVEAGELTHARQALLDAIDQEPGRADLLFELGLLELRLDNPEAAAFNFSSAAHAFGHRFDLVYNQAISLAEAGDFAAASQLLQEAINAGRIPPELRAQVLEALGDAQYEAGAYQLAATTFQQLHELTEAPTAEYKNLLARFEMGQRTELVVPLRRLREAVGHKASLLLAHVYYDTALGAYGERELLDTRARAIEEVNFEAFADATVALAGHYYEAARYDDAITLLIDLPSRDSNFEAQYLLGITYLAAGHAEDAFGVFQTTPPSRPEIFSLLAVLSAVAAEQPAAAHAHIERMLREYAGSAPNIARSSMGSAAFIAAAQAYLQTGHIDEAAGVASLIPRAGLPHHAAVQLGDILYQLGDYPEAARVYENVLAQLDVDPDVYLAAARNFADALLAAKRWRDAQAAYERVIGITPYDTVAYYNYGWALAGTNETGPARAAFETAASRGYKPAQDVLRSHF